MSTEPTPAPSSSARLTFRKLIPLAVFVVALAIRVIGIGWGLKNDLHNQSYHPDEGDIFAYSQQIEPTQFKFTPGFYNYGTLYLTALRVASDMTAAYTGGMDPKNEDSVWSYVARCNLAGRLISAVAGAGTVVVVFCILRRLTSLYGSLAGAAILAFSPAHVVHSRFQTVDVSAVLLLSLSALFALKVIEQDGEDPPSPKQAMKWIVLAGVFAGLSGGTKYTGLLGLLTILTVLFLVRRQTFAKEAAVATASTLLAFVVATPGVLLDSSNFQRDFTYEMAHTSTGHGLVFEGTANGFLFHFGNLLQGLGTFATLMGLAALCFCAYRRRVWAIALLAFFIPYYIVIGRAEAKFMRYTFPLYIALSVGCGWAVGKGLEQKRYGRFVVAAGILAIGGVDGGGLMGTTRYTGYMVGEDPRDAAARYLKEQAKGDKSYLVGLPEDPWFWSPPLFTNSTASRAMKRSIRDADMDAATEPKVTYYRNPDGRATQFDKRLVTDIGPNAVTCSSFEYEDAERLQGRTDVSETGKALARDYKAFMEVLQQHYDLDQRFGDIGPMTHDMEYVQPAVLVWKRKK
ncbi:MAG: glycosyltransferase family 39 protein [Fimbriimonas sp.]|nr:glycosyltransferase family 39 protein [Fimbriimonas sp.]